MIQIGIIGMGIRGKLFAQTISQNDYAEVAAVSDPNAATLQEVTETFGVKGYGRYQDMIDETRLDAVIVATPDFLHKAPVLYAASRKRLIQGVDETATEATDRLGGSLALALEGARRGADLRGR